MLHYLIIPVTLGPGTCWPFICWFFWSYVKMRPTAPVPSKKDIIYPVWPNKDVSPYFLLHRIVHCRELNTLSQGIRRLSERTFGRSHLVFGVIGLFPV